MPTFELLTYNLEGWGDILNTNWEKVRDYAVLKNDYGNLILPCPDTSAPDGELTASTLHFYLDEGGNIFKVKIRKSTGTYETYELSGSGGGGGGGPAYPPGYKYGLLVHDNRDGDTIQINPGQCRDAENSKDMSISSPITIGLSTNLDTGTEINDTFYNVFLVWNDILDNYYGIFSVSEIPIITAGHKYRKICTLRNGSTGNLLPFTICGNGMTIEMYYRDTSLTNVLSAGTATVYTDVDVSSLVPPGRRTSILVVDCSADVYLRTKGDTFDNYFFDIGDKQSVIVKQELDTNRIFQYYRSGSGSATIFCSGYVDEL